MAAPGKPTNARWTRQSGRNLTLLWDGGAGAARFQIAWQQGGDTRPVVEKWVTAGRSFRITSMPGNTGTRFAINAWNNVGQSSGWSNFTPWFYTPPLVPTRLALVSTPEGLVGSWSREGSYFRHGTELEWSDGSKTLLGNGTNGAAPTSFTNTELGGSDVRFRARSFVGAASPAGQRVFSTWSAWSNPVGHLVPPNPPRVISPIGLVIAGSDVTFEWEHQPRDSSVQMGAQIRYRHESAGGAWTVETITGDTTKHTVSGLLVGGYEFQIRTMGMSLEYGEWTPVQGVLAATRPTTTIVTPTAGTYPSSILTVTWNPEQAEGIPQSAAMVTVLQNGGVLAQKSVNGPDTTATFGQFRLDNHSTYDIQLWVEMSRLRSTVATRTITTEFIKPAIPVLTVTWDDVVGCHNIETNIGPMSGAVKPTVRLSLEKSLDGRDWELLDSDLPLSLSASVDWFGRSAGNTYYRLTAFTDEDATAEVIVISDPKSGAFWLAAGPDFTSPIRLAFGEGDPPKYSIDGARERHVEYYAGRELGVPSVGDKVEREVSFSGIIFEDMPGNCTREEFEQVVLAKTPRHLLRAPTGDLVYLTLDSTPIVRSQHMVWNFSVSGDQVEAP